MVDLRLVDMGELDPPPEHMNAAERGCRALLGDLVRAATARPAGEEATTPLRCPGRGRKSSCSGRLRVHRQEVPSVIRWTCVRCGHEGRITGWRETRWDLSEIETPESADELELVLPQASYDLVKADVSGIDPRAARIVAGAEWTPEGVFLRGTPIEFEELAGPIAFEINRRGFDRTARQLGAVLGRIDRSLVEAGAGEEPPPDRAPEGADESSGAARAPASVLELEITLEEIEPPVRRRLLVDADTDLERLHVILQRTMGWESAHLYEFRVPGWRYGEPDPDWDPSVLPAVDTLLSEVAPGEGAGFEYLYDFGDGWSHRIEVTRTMPPEPGLRVPVCTGGRRACPPEDSGGPWGYAELLDALGDPDHPDQASMRTWAGEGFDPETFDLDLANVRLEGLRPKATR